MRVLAKVMDSWMAGHVGRAGDIMAQRFRALEYVATERGSWSKAKHLELAPLDGATSLTPGLRGDMNRQKRVAISDGSGGQTTGPRENKSSIHPSRGRRAPPKTVPNGSQEKGISLAKGIKRETKAWRATNRFGGASSGQTRKDPNECGALL